MRRALVVAGLIVVLAGLVATTHFAHDQVLARRSMAADIDAHLTLPTPGAARLMFLSYNELFADLTWIRSLIYYGDGLVTKHGMPDVEKLVLLINRLDPWFRRAYQWGAHATTFRNESATQEEYLSSVEILRRGVAQFPGDWELAWLLGVRLFLDLKPADPAERQRLREEGAMYIERAMRSPGAPADIAVLAATLRTRLGQKDRALRELRAMILNTEDEKARVVLQAKFAVMASATESRELERHARELDAEWKRNLPYVPRSTYLLLGPPPPATIDLNSVAAGEVFNPTTEEDD